MWGGGRQVLSLALVPPAIILARGNAGDQAACAVAADANRVVEMFRRYVTLARPAISRAQAQERTFAKAANPGFLPDVRPSLPAARAETLTEKSTAEALLRVFMTLVDRLPG